jgi:protein TonB
VDVTDVLRDRMQEPRGLQGMVAISLAIHVTAVAVLLLLPGSLLKSTPPPRTIMTISLAGGNGGPDNGGMTSIGGRPVQQETPPEPPKRPEPVRPPAVATPELTVPIPTKAPPKPAKPTPPAPVVKNAPDDARGRTPTKGPETRQGSAVVETGARGQGFGLSTSGGTGSGSSLDVSDFCCPDYLALMVERIRTNWSARADVPGTVVVKYTIQRDGTISGAEIEQKSGYAALDINAFRAVLGTRQLAPLPAAFPNQTLTVHLNFQYTR